MREESVPPVRFRRAAVSDMEPVAGMYRAAVSAMEEHHIMQWDDVYPDRSVLEADIMRGEMYVGHIGDVLVAAYVINRECDQAYDAGDWVYPDSPCFIVHRLCVSPEFQHCGVGRAAMESVERWAVNRGAETIRLDCFTLNPFACALYRSLDYRVVGRVTWRKGDFFLFEKKIAGK